MMLAALLGYAAELSVTRSGSAYGIPNLNVLKRIDPEIDDERRIYYELTGLGQQVLAAELQRYREVVAVAGRRRLLPKTLAYGS